MRANSLVEQHQPLVGDKYLLVRLLGSGGAGLVFEARHRLTGTRVAIKLLHQSVPEDELALKRFVREAQAVATLRSEHIVGFRDLAEGPRGNLLLVMELLQGQTLKELLSAGPLSLPRALPLLVDACRGVADAHRAGFVHRDLKPANLYVQASGQCKVLDLGLAKRFEGGDTLTGEASLLGTVEYMAPEQVTEEGVVDERTDVFALGVIFFEVLVGRRPHEAAARAGLMYKIANRDAPSLGRFAPHLPAAVIELIDRCLQRDRSLRPASAEDLWQVFRTMRSVEQPSRSSRRALTWRRALRGIAPGLGGAVADTTAPRSSERGPPPKAGQWWPVAAVVAAGGVGLWFAANDGHRQGLGQAQLPLSTRSPTDNLPEEAVAGPVQGDRATARQGAGPSSSELPLSERRFDGPKTEPQPVSVGAPRVLPVTSVRVDPAPQRPAPAAALPRSTRQNRSAPRPSSPHIPLMPSYDAQDPYASPH